jgi:hypothetical protein
MARRFKIALDLDERTSALSDAALVCRTFGHKWERRALSRSRVTELLKVGCAEYYRYCEHGCGSTWRQVWSFRERMMVENERTYPKNGEYLLPSGTGRLDRAAAREAQFVREYTDLLG